MPGLSSGHMDLGLALMRRAACRRPRKALLHAREIREDSRVLVNLGALYYQELRFAEAAALFGQAAAAEPSNATILENLGDACRHLGRVAEMRQAYRKALDLESAALGRNPRDGVAHARMAFVLAELGDRNRASFEMAQALALSGADQDVIVDAALTYEALGQRDRALAALASAPGRLLQALTRAARRQGPDKGPSLSAVTCEDTQSIMQGEEMAHQTITLTYDPATDAVHSDPATIRLEVGDTVEFTSAQGPVNILFLPAGHFSANEFHLGDKPVQRLLLGPAKICCGVVVDGKLLGLSRPSAVRPSDHSRRRRFSATGG